MTDDRLPWFPCYPSKLLGALAAMKCPEGYVYVVVLLRIYEVGGPCRDTVEAIATRTRLNKRVVSDALDRLFKAGKLQREGDGIINPVAAAVLSDSNALHAERVRAGREGGLRAAEKRKLNQKKEPSRATATLQPSGTHLHLQEQEQKKEESKGSKRRASALHPLPDDWALSASDVAYATKRGFVAAQVESMSAAFSNHHLAKGSLMAKWDAAWRTWVENEIKFQRRSGAHENHRGTQQSGLNFGYDAISSRLKARGTV